MLIRNGMGLLEGKRVGLVCNQTSVLPNGTHLADTLLALGVKLKALFGPEHGVRGSAAAGELINDSLDARTHLPVRSLYGRTRKPTPAMLADIDVLLFDLQDVGARFFTYAATMAYCMEACGENGKMFVVLDRPNPVNGIDIEGPVIDSTVRSFIGFLPIPIRHGMTLGELARMIAGEGWMKFPRPSDLHVVAMQGWQRTMWYDDTGLLWIAPSPNMKSTATATVYPGMCLFEATNLCEGRGTDAPFETIGAPWINAGSLAAELNSSGLRGVRFDPATFTPQAGAAAPSPRFKDTTCQGITIKVTNRDQFVPVLAGLYVLSAVKRLYPSNFRLLEQNFGRLFGQPEYEITSQWLIQDPHNPVIPWNYQIDRFRGMRAKYLLY